MTLNVVLTPFHPRQPPQDFTCPLERVGAAALDREVARAREQHLVDVEKLLEERAIDATVDQQQVPHDLDAGFVQGTHDAAVAWARGQETQLFELLQRLADGSPVHAELRRELTFGR